MYDMRKCANMNIPISHEKPQSLLGMMVLPSQQHSNQGRGSLLGDDSVKACSLLLCKRGALLYMVGILVLLWLTHQVL